MRTVIETEIFKRYADNIWSDPEREEFITWIATNPLAGDVIPGSGGLRKVRWSRPGMGKRGGARDLLQRRRGASHLATDSVHKIKVR